MEEMFRNHKDVPFGWALALDDWRKSRARRRLRAQPRPEAVRAR